LHPTTTPTFYTPNTKISLASAPALSISCPAHVITCTPVVGVRQKLALKPPEFAYSAPNMQIKQRRAGAALLFHEINNTFKTIT
jgi:hypothetical protein